MKVLKNLALANCMLLSVSLLLSNARGATLRQFELAGSPNSTWGSVLFKQFDPANGNLTQVTVNFMGAFTHGECLVHNPNPFDVDVSCTLSGWAGISVGSSSYAGPPGGGAQTMMLGEAHGWVPANSSMYISVSAGAYPGPLLTIVDSQLNQFKGNGSVAINWWTSVSSPQGPYVPEAWGEGSSASGGDIEIIYTYAVPEPEALTLLAGGLGLLFSRRRG